MSLSTKLKRIFKQFIASFQAKDTSILRTAKNSDFVFVHINKTGGNSIAEAVGIRQIAHLTVKEIIDQIGVEAWQKAYTFTVVRNPWDKVVSHYNFRIKTNQTEMKSNPINFKDWLDKTYGNHTDSFYYDQPKMFQSQIEWLKDYDDLIQIDKIIRFENLEQEYAKVAQIIGCSPKLPHLNKTNRSNYKDYYDEETKELISEWFKEDIDYFGYTFED